MLFNQVLWISTPVLVAAVGFFVARSMANTDGDIKELYRHVERLDRRVDDVEKKHTHLQGEHNAIHNIIGK